MTYAVLSDIHGNLEALQAVEAALDALPVRIDAYLLLGDLVGYNADPAACLARGLQIASCCIRGNHDKVVAGIASDRDFNDVAQAAARRHRRCWRRRTWSGYAPFSRGRCRRPRASCCATARPRTKTCI